MKDLKKRTITAIVMIALLIPVVYFGGIVMEVLASILTLLAAYELEKMFKKENNWSVYNFFNILVSLGSFFVFYYSLMMKNYYLVLALLIVLFIVQGFMMIFTANTDGYSLGNSLITIFYPSIGFSTLAFIRNVNIEELWHNGFFILLYGVIICMMTDMFAYFFGSKFGKHKLCERISPKKSWEGSIAGTVFAVVFGTVFAYFTGVGTYLFPFANDIGIILLLILLSLLLSIIDEIGDLFASKLKRTYGIKDYSQIFPGHGGVLDRFDSYIFVSTALACLILISSLF